MGRPKGKKGTSKKGAPKFTTKSCGLCDKLDNIDMVCCDSCDMWYHFKCVGVNKGDLGDKWKCPTCKQKQAEVRTAEIQSSDKRPSSRDSKRDRPPSSHQSSDKRPSSRDSKRDRRPSSHQSSDKRPFSRDSERDRRPISRHSEDIRSPSHSRDRQTTRIVSSRFSYSPTRNFMGSLYTRTEFSNWTEKERSKEIELQQIGEERHLQEKRDQEYLEKKYRIFQRANREPDEVSSFRQSYTEKWAEHQKENLAKLHQHEPQSEPKSIKSFTRNLDEIQYDSTSPQRLRKKVSDVRDMEFCDVCYVISNVKTFVDCCLCIKRGHHTCMDTIMIDKEAYWICPGCKTPIVRPKIGKQSANQLKADTFSENKATTQATKVVSEDRTDMKFTRRKQTISADHKIPDDKAQRCDICNKDDNNKPFRPCDICDKYYHFACLDIVLTDNQITWICAGCKGIKVTQKTDKENISTPFIQLSKEPIDTQTKDNFKSESKSNDANIPSGVHGDPNISGDANIPRGPQNLNNSTANQGNRSNLTSTQIASRHVIAKDLPYFNGKPEDWPIFISRFENSTINCGFSNAENLDRLQRCLKGNALEAVRSRLNIPESVPDIIQTLRLLYGRPELIVNSLLKKIRQQPPPKADKLNTLVDFALAVKNLSATMEQADLTECSSNPALILELVEKLPTNIKIEWAKYKTGLGQRRITLTVLGDWLYRLPEVVSTVTEPTPSKEKSFDKIESSDKYKPSRANVHQNYYTGNKSNAESSTSVNQPKSEENCQICKKNCRKLEECSVFKSYNPEQRWKAMVESKVCRKCLKRHSGYCKSDKICGVNGCTCKHHRLLHDQAKHSAYTNDKTNPSSDVTQALHHVHLNSMPNVFYRIVPVTLYNECQAIQVLAYLDEGSDLTLIDRQLAAELNLSGVPERLCLLWTAKVHRFEEKSAIVNLEISGQNEFTRRFKLLGVRTVEDLALPEQTINKQMLTQKYPYLKGIPFIEYYGAPRIMIGLANARLCTQIQKFEGKEFEPIASRSRIGWSIHGPTREPNKNLTQNSYRILVCQKDADDEIYHKLVKEHFTIENFGVQVNNSLNAGSKEDERAVKMLQSYTKRTKNGFETGLLFKNEFIDLPDSYGMAKRRLICLEKQKPSRIQAIDDKIKDYIAKGYVTKLDQHEINAKIQRVWYLPIFTVVYPKKPNKIRLVFDAAAEVHGISLNKILLKGPDQVSSLVDILRRFREKRVAVNGDIKEMFHQIEIRKEDRHLQRFLWRNGDESKEPDIYVLNVMSFAATCSPSSAQFVKNTNALEFEKKYPQAVKSIIENHYVDDMMDGEHTEEKAIQLVHL